MTGISHEVNDKCEHRHLILFPPAAVKICFHWQKLTNLGKWRPLISWVPSPFALASRVRDVNLTNADFPMMQFSREDDAVPPTQDCSLLSLMNDFNNNHNRGYVMVKLQRLCMAATFGSIYHAGPLKNLTSYKQICHFKKLERKREVSESSLHDIKTRDINWVGKAASDSLNYDSGNSACLLLRSLGHR